MKHYYIPFIPKAEINYLHLFELMEQASYSPSTKAYDTISYKSIAKLAEKLSYSSATLDRMLSGDKYSLYLSADKENKIIKLNTAFNRGNITQPFVCLTDTEISFLRMWLDSYSLDQNASVASSDLRTDRLRKKARTDKIMRNIPKHRNNIISDLLLQK